MTPQEFCYWLQGYFELSQDTHLTERQTTQVKNHLSLVFLHSIDPAQPGDPAVSQAVHDGEILPTAADNAHLFGQHTGLVRPRC